MSNKIEGRFEDIKLIELISDSAVLFSKNGEVSFQNKSASTLFGKIQNFWSFFSLDINSIDFNDLEKNIQIVFQHRSHFKNYTFTLQIIDSEQFFVLIAADKSINDDSNIHHIYYQIGNLTKTTKNLDDLLRKIHILLIDQLQAHNMTVCIDNKENNSLDFIYYFDEDQGGRKDSYSRPKANGLTEYVLNTKVAHLFYEEEIEDLKIKGKVYPIGTIPKIWIGVPMIYNNELIGVLSVKSHSNRNKFSRADLEFLQFITVQISFGIERKIYEDKITDQTARLKSIFESGDQLIWSVNKKRQLTSFNENYAKVIEQLHGARPKIEEQKNKILLLSAGEFTDLITEKYNLAFKGIPQQYETSFVENNGTTTWRQMFLSPIYSKDGGINQISGIAHDVTYKKLNELAVAESEKKFRHIFETLQDIYVMFNGRDEIETISPSVLQITGFEPHELIGKNVRDFFVPKQKGDLELLKKILVEDKSIKNFELNILTKSGELIPSLVNLDALLNNHNKTIGVQGVVRDIYELQTITEELKKAKIEAEHSLKVKENFLANMSHEIRTPMNGIVAMIDMLQETQLNADQKDFVDTVQQSSNVLMKILNDILDLSKLEAGKMDIRKDKVSVQSILEKTYLLFSQRAKSKKILFDFCVDPNIPKTIISDETRLIQILLNLTSNAIKFTDQDGSVIIKADLIKNYYDSSTIKFTVKDTGIGIEPNEKEKLFQSFNQIDSSITKKYGGTGLGLSISKELCTLLGGTIEVVSTKGKGSEFSFTINTPKNNAALEENKQLIPKTATENRNLLNKKVLIVDDNEVNRKVCSLLLHNEKATYKTATNGKNALESLQSENFDVILMDIQMPVLDGIATLGAIKKRNLAPNTKIIALTAYAMEKDKERFLSLGFDNYLAKPITRESLIKAILDPPISLNHTENISDKMFDQTIRQNIENIGGIELYFELLHDFIEETTPLLVELKEAFSSKNTDEIHQISHQIKGSAASVSLNKLSTIAHKIEQESKKNDSLELYSALGELLEAYENFKHWLKHNSNEKNINS